MEEVFIPKRLIQAREEIIDRHPGKKKIIETAVRESKEIRKLIERIVALPERKVKKEAFTLSDLEMASIAGYCPSNRFKVKLDNLEQVLYYRSDPRFWEIYYRAWQDYYLIAENNSFLLKQVKRDEIFVEFMKEHHLDESNCQILFGSEDVPHSLGELFYDSKLTIEKSLSERLTFFGVRENTRLYNECAIQFYTYCSRKEYLDGSKDEVEAAVRKYGLELLRKFLLNFLAKLSLSDMDSFPALGQYFLKEIGEISTEKARQLFNGFPKELSEKYSDWLIRLRIDELFEKDERSRFWRQYHFKKVQRYRISNSVVLEFDHHCAIEFLGRAMGPLYIYEKDCFEEKIQDLVNRRMNNTDLRQTLYHGKSYLKRIEHQSGWQLKTKRFLLNNSITRFVMR